MFLTTPLNARNRLSERPNEFVDLVNDISEALTLCLEIRWQELNLFSNLYFLPTYASIH